jgi:hypothetical protein
MTHMFPREGASSSSTSMSSQRSETHDDRMIAMVLSEEYAKLDGAMAKHLINLTSIPVRCLMNFSYLYFPLAFPFLPRIEDYVFWAHTVFLSGIDKLINES